MQCRFQYFDCTHHRRGGGKGKVKVKIPSEEKQARVRVRLGRRSELKQLNQLALLLSTVGEGALGKLAT